MAIVSIITETVDFSDVQSDVYDISKWQKTIGNSRKHIETRAEICYNTIDLMYFVWRCWNGRDRKRQMDKHR